IRHWSFGEAGMAWSNSRQSWNERIGVGLLLLAAVALGWFGRPLPLAYQVVLWGAWVVALAALARRGWLRLFGPVLFYDLVRNGAIVLGELAVRLLNLLMVVLAALPVLSATEFFGGVDPELLLASFVGLGLTMLGLSSVSILMSVYARRPRDAIVLTYLIIVL